MTKTIYRLVGVSLAILSYLFCFIIILINISKSWNTMDISSKIGIISLFIFSSFMIVLGILNYLNKTKKQLLTIFLIIHGIFTVFFAVTLFFSLSIQILVIIIVNIPSLPLIFLSLYSSNNKQIRN